MPVEAFMRWLIAGAVAVVATTATAAPQTYPSSAGNLMVETIATGLSHPWALAFLPDGRLVVTERAGRIRIVGKDGKHSPPLAGVPQVAARGQGGLHDVVLDRDYGQNNTIYFCFAEPASGGARTALARAKLIDGATPRLDDVKVIFHDAIEPKDFGDRDELKVKVREVINSGLPEEFQSSPEKGSVVPQVQA